MRIVPASTCSVVPPITALLGALPRGRWARRPLHEFQPTPLPPRASRQHRSVSCCVPPSRCRSEGMDCDPVALAAAIAPFLAPAAAALSMRGLAAFLAADDAGARGAAADVGLEGSAGLSADRPALARVVSGGARQATSFDAASLSPAASRGSSSGAGAPPAVAASPPAARPRQSRTAGRTAKDDRELEAARAQAERASAALASDEVVARSVGGAMRAARLPVLRRALKQQDTSSSGRLTATQLHAALMRVAAATGAEAGPLGRVGLAQCEALVRARGDGGAIDASSLSAIISGQPAAAAARARGPRSRLAERSRAKPPSPAPAEPAVGEAAAPPGFADAESGARSASHQHHRQHQRPGHGTPAPRQSVPRSSPVKTPGAASHAASSPVGGASGRSLRHAAAAGSPAHAHPPRSSPVLRVPVGSARESDAGWARVDVAGFAPARDAPRGPPVDATAARGRAARLPEDAPAGHTRGDGGQWQVALRQLADAVATASRGARHVFAACDRDSAGRVSGADLVARMPRFGCSLDPAAADSLVARFDRSGDDTLTMSEFVSMLATAA